ncbi:PhzF family phenazine biosynthesis protein [Methylobacterium nodulans]|uniref:Phenazine biosynthesis protein PhzF family n=1 Tax=Methylobacterium nodulans (strain LMG 21967 / CNCM I-2342 / ORS 2060) TaxID=460265 RepID=B8IHT1_METNO|nr:PhzF family phenazine biosynthesis protein [Methylobacterium nodulans]ACL55969.1 phenazine biosynthesis protein PhzF family [Methylobacterium nodulans ORS 2060]
MTARRFVTLDVFTERPLAGNPLAVVLDAEGLDAAAMQAIAREFNLSETVFVLPPRDARHRAHLRIFTPAQELPFAGHPTVGTAVLLGLHDRRAGVADAVAFGLEEKVGVVPCVVEPGEGRGRARFRLPRLPEIWGEAEGLGPEPAPVASSLGLEVQDIGFARHWPSRHSAGTPFDLVPVRSLDALGRARPNAEALDRAFGPGAKVFLYTGDTGDSGHSFRARMFAPSVGVAEDPATGSAVAAFAGALMQFEPLGEGTHDFVIAQGHEMGRPSEIALQMVIAEGALRAAEVGGSAVVVTEGEIRV